MSCGLHHKAPHLTLAQLLSNAMPFTRMCIFLAPLWRVQSLPVV